MKLRPGTLDEEVMREVYTENCYRVPADLSGQVVIDVGCHIGTFAKLCAERGASVLAFEIEAENVAIARENLADYPQARIMHQAVWKPCEITKVAPSGMYMTADGLLKNTGSSHVFIASASPGYVETITLEEILSPFERVAIVKLDCEGAEFEIVPATKSWDKVERLVGEVHGYRKEYDRPSFYMEVKKHFHKLEVVPTCPEFGLEIFFASR